MQQSISTDHRGAALVIDILAEKGVSEVVLSPGSRNAPLILAVVHHPKMHYKVIVDERSAAFYALGIAQQRGEPVALICTSGTALLNYAPAVAEAYYHSLPLIVLSADRPEAWIDQEDSQTIRQYKALEHFVKGSYQLSSEIYSDEGHWYTNRTLNEAINRAVSGKPAPVHINISISEPLYGLDREYWGGEERIVRTITPSDSLSAVDIAYLAQRIVQRPRVMIVVGFLPPNSALTEALKAWAARDNVVVLTESISNQREESFITTIDRVLAALPDNKESYRPDTVISFGGALVSKQIKQFLRDSELSEHILLYKGEQLVDTFTHLTTQIAVDPASFLSQLLPQVAESIHSDYAQRWRAVTQVAEEQHNTFAQRVEWSDWLAFDTLLSRMPCGSKLQFSNGTSVRYAQLFTYPQVARCDSNRGTSGIDGSTSTAIGAAMVDCESLMVLITGDISFMYDANALWIRQLPENLRIVVMCNGGGGIFRYIIPESGWGECMEECFETAQQVDVAAVAALHQIAYREASSVAQLHEVLTSAAWQHGKGAMILGVNTPRTVNDKVLKSYFFHLKGEL